MSEVVVAQNFVPCDRDQQLLLPPSLREWLPEDHLAWFVLDVVEQMDLEAFYGAYREDGWGRAAFSPAMMTALLFYAYAIGERSSRAIERRCREDVAFRVISANQIPDHATIARFRARHQQALGETFTQVLALCARAGLVSLGLVALDGTLMGADAARAANRLYPAIAAEVEAMLDQAARADAEEDARLGEARGDELPAEWRGGGSRRERLARLKRELEEAQAAKQAAYEAKLAERAEREAQMGRRLGGRKPHPPDPAGLARSRANTTDPDSRPMARAGRSLQGYNAQVVACPGQIILAAELTQAANDSGQLEPMLLAAQRALAQAGQTGPIDVVVADGGYWNSAAITAARRRGTQALIPTYDPLRTRPRRLGPRQGAEAARIEDLLGRVEGKALYRRRQQVVEPIFAQIKVLRRAGRFMRRGLRACQSEWRLLAATHNLLKLWRASLLNPAQ